MLTATAYYNVIARDYAGALARTATDSTITRETKYYLANVGKVKSVDALLRNDRLYAYAMKAFGLSDMTNAKGLIRKVLEGGVSSDKSLANTLHDPRYKALAIAFNFPANGAATTTAAAAQKGVADKYLEISLESNAGKQNSGVQMALYFRRMAPNITSAYSILADKTLLKVVQTAFGLPPSMSQGSIDLQARTIGKLLKIGDLQNPAKLQKFIERFAASYDAKNAAAPPTTPLSPLFAASTTVGLNSDLLLRLADLKLGGS